MRSEARLMIATLTAVTFSSSAWAGDKEEDGGKEDVRVEFRATGEEGEITLHEHAGSAQVQTVVSTSNGTAFGTGVVDAYDPLCTAPCETEVAPGTRRLALSLGKGTPVEPENFVRIEGPSRLEGEYTSYAGMRLAGWLTMLGSAGVGTYLMLSSIGADETCDSSGYCTESFDSTRLYAGAGVMLAGGIVGLVLSGKSDEAEIRVVPMSTATTDGSYKSASVQELVLPTGGAISGQF